MSVKLNIPSYLQPYTNHTGVVEVDGSTVGDCLNRLVTQFPSIGKMVFAEEDKLLDYVSIYIDGEFAYGDELAKPVKDGDELHIVYLIGGG